MKQKTVRVGKIVGFFGLKGEAKVNIISDFADERFQVGKSLILKNDGKDIELVIRSVRYHKNQALIAFENYPDLTAVEKLPRNDLMVNVEGLDENEGVHSFEYQGCEVYDTLKQKRGIVLRWEAGSAHGLLRVKTEDRDVLIPVVDAFILEKDVKHKRIVVNWMDGL